MPQQTACLKIPKKRAEETLALANRLAISDLKMEIQRDEGFVYLPVVREPPNDTLCALREKVPEIEIVVRVCDERRRHQATLVDLFAGKMPADLLPCLPHSADFVGDIAVVEIPSELRLYGPKIGEAILATNKNVRTVLSKAGAVGGTYRTRRYTVLAGEPKTETVHREYGCQYYVDLAKAYFSPRLSSEHNRVAALVREGETVLDMFAGVGPFTIRIAKTHKNVTVHAIDVNPDAVEYLRRNIRLNRVEERVHASVGDARQIVNERLVGSADRVIMNLPESAKDFVDVACAAVKPSGGTVHFYGFTSVSSPVEDMKRDFIETVTRYGRKVAEGVYSKLVRATAPYEWQVVLDVQIK